MITGVFTKIVLKVKVKREFAVFFLTAYFQQNRQLHWILKNIIFKGLKHKLNLPSNLLLEI